MNDLKMLALVFIATIVVLSPIFAWVLCVQGVREGLRGIAFALVVAIYAMVASYGVSLVLSPLING